MNLNITSDPKDRVCKHKHNIKLIIGLILTSAIFFTGSMAGENCDLVQIDAHNHQYDPNGAFVGTTEVTFLSVDPDTGVTTPTGESLFMNCEVSLLAFYPELKYKTNHICTGAPGTRVEFSATHTGSLVPLENDPDGFEYGFLDSGEILTGKGRWTCGSDAVGINAATGEFNARGRLWTPEAPGEFVGTGLARWCDCSEQ